MKKLLVAIIAFVYLSTSVGANVHLHYCMGKLAGWGFGHNDAKKCAACGMEQSVKKVNGCCKEEHKFFQNNTDKKYTETAFQMAQLIAVAMPVSFFAITSVRVSSLTEESPVTHAPPRGNGVAVYIRNRAFRI